MSIGKHFSPPGIRSAIHRWRSDERGSVAIMVGFMAIAFSMMLGLVVEEAQIYRTTMALKASTAMAALAAAQDIDCCTTLTAIARAQSYSALNPIKEATVTMVSGYPKLKCLTSTGVSCAGTDNANAIVVSQQATIPLVFGSFIGQSTKTVTATATAAREEASGNRQCHAHRRHDGLHDRRYRLSVSEPPGLPARKREPGTCCRRSILPLSASA